jgi:hypothetical protein
MAVPDRQAGTSLWLATQSALAKFPSSENTPTHKIQKIDLQVTNLLQILTVCNNSELLWRIV